MYINKEIIKSFRVGRSMEVGVKVGKMIIILLERRGKIWRKE